MGQTFFYPKYQFSYNTSHLFRHFTIQNTDLSVLIDAIDTTSTVTCYVCVYVCVCVCMYVCMYVLLYTVYTYVHFKILASWE